MIYGIKYFFKKIYQKLNYKDWIIFFLLSLTLPLFFYKLGQSSLVSFDEAWYADISRNILKTGDLINLYWNGAHYIDHPPAGFWLMALAQKLLGLSEFSARITPAICGILSVYVLYLLGREIFNRVVGFLSGVALSSAIWFVYRARSGNLDVILTFFFLLTFYLAFKAVKDKKFFLPFLISLGFLILTKTIVPFTILPALLLIFWENKVYKFKDVYLPIISLIVCTSYWFYVQTLNHNHFFERYFAIGLPGIKIESSFLDNLKLMKEYLHNGIGKWFWPGVGGITLGLFLVQKRFYILALFFLTFFIPFIFSSKGHIWHLVPLHPFMILAFFGASYTLIEKITKKSFLASLLIVFGFIFLYFPQVKQIWFQFIDIPRFISDEAILSKEAGKFPQKFYIDGDFGPTAVYYSGKNVQQISITSMEPLFVSGEDFILITYQWRLDQAKIPTKDYKLIKKDRDKLLIKRESIAKIAQ